LGRVPGTRRYSDIERNPDNEIVPHVVIVRVESGILYFNVSHVRDEIRRHIATTGSELHLVVWDLSTSPYVDIAGVRLIREFQADLAARGAALRIVDARASVRDLIRKEVGVSVGEISRKLSLDDAVMGVSPSAQ
jgi:MFS superfamily sulfate permease-like transporter